MPSNATFLGLPVPGRTPLVYFPDIFSDTDYRLHGPIVFAPDMRQICWSVIPPAIMSVSVSSEGWADPAPLDLQGRVIQSPAFSPDGRHLYYQAVAEDGGTGVFIWRSERTDEGWGDPLSVGPNVNICRLQSQPCLTADSSLYYTGTLEGVCFERGIYRSRLVDGVYQQPELLSRRINSDHIDYCPWIAPDESYLLFASSRPRSEEPLYIHIAFRSADGSWTEPQSIHQAIGFESPARFPSVSPDGRFLFFISGNSAYWVDIAPVLELN